MRKLFLTLCVCIGAALASHGQGTFRNLDFEQARVPVVQPSQQGTPVAVSNGLPGWTAYIGADVQTNVLHNAVPLAPAFVAILGPYFPYDILEGDYTAMISAGVSPESSETPVSASIGQAGRIPADARSLWFKMGASYPAYTRISFAGQALQIVPVTVSPNYALYAANVGVLANSLGELRFTALPTPTTPFNSMVVDSISFSTQPIPEPGVAALLGLGALVAVWRGRPQR